MSQLMKKKFPSITSIDVGTDGNTSFLRAARNGQLEKVLEHLESNIDINTSNANGLNALHLASKDGHVEIVEELLKRGAVIDAATKKGNTALHIASLAGQEEVVKLLVTHGASVNVQSQNGFTPLYMAAQENHDNVVKYLLANGANQSLSTEDGFTPLAVAMQQGHDKVVTVLLENDTRGKVRLPALHIAAKKDDVKAAKLLLENEHNPDVTSKSGFTPLHIASHYGNQSIANLLVQKGADVNYSAKHNITPLHVAAKWGKTNMVTVLLEQGANIESKTRDGLTPLHCAARSGHEQVVDMLLEKGAPISSKTKNGLAPLHMAAQGDHVDAARILLYHRAPVDEVTVDYLTALHVAAHCGHVRVAKLLLDRQADANARALNGFTPLHIACKKNRIKVVELLLKHGASIGATTESGLTPLHVASFMGCMNIVIYLLQHDANPDVPTVRGETPLHLAARANQTDIIRILLRNGAQVDARAREQQTPLHIASRLGNVDIVMLLLQHGAKVDNTTKDMYTALHIAAKEGQDEVAAALIDNGASLNATTKKGFTPLHLAAKYGHLKVAKLLLQKEAPVDAQGKNGVTPLHVASHYDHQNVALLLLEKGASPYATAKNGHTPLHIAAKKNQMDIANTLLEYGAKPNAESKAGFTPLHLSAQEGHCDMTDLLIEHKADTNHKARNGLTPLHLCAQEDKVPVADILVKNGGEVDVATKNGYTPLHIASHYGQINMVRFLLSHGANVKATTSLGYTPLHQAAQQGHTNIVNTLLENSAQPNAVTNSGQTPLHIAEKLGYITVIDTLKVVTQPSSPMSGSPISNDEKYRVVAPEAMHETFMSDSEEEGGEDTVLGDQTYRYLTADEMKSLGDDSLPIDVTRDERIDSNKIIANAENMMPPRHIEDNISPEHVQQNYVEYIKKYTPDNVDIDKHPISIGFLVSFLVDARGGAMRGCRHSGVRVIVPPRCASSPTRITCRYVRPQRTPHPPPLMEGEALASRVLELGPVGAKFLGPVIIEVPHFAALRGKEREIVILRSDNGESWKEHTVEATEEVLNEVLHDSFDAEDLNQLEDISSGRITRIVTQDFPQYFAVVSRVRQEVHAIGPEGGMVSSTVVPQVQAVFPQGALTKKIKVGLQAQPIDPELTAKLLGHGVAVSPVVTVEPRRRKFHKAITLSMPAPRAHSQGMINQYSGNAPTLRLLCSITGGTTRAQWEDVTGSTPLTFVNDCVSFTTTVSARFWLMDCRNVGDATKMATELYREAIHVPFMAKFVVFAKRVDPLEARLRVFCMTDDKEDKTLEHQEHFTEVAKSRDVEVLEGKPQYIEFAGNLVPITKSGEQLQFSFRAFRENRLPFSVRVKDQHAEAVSRCLFMREPKMPKGEPPQQPICILNIVLPDDIVVDTISLTDTDSVKKIENFDYYRPDPRLADMSNLLGDDWVPLAAQLGLTTSEINVIKSEYPDSVAKQAQSMLRMWLSQSGNKAQTNTLESALRRIGREDIIPQCLNVDYSSHGMKEIGKQRLIKKIEEYEKDIIKESESVIKMVDEEKKKENFDKYSAEEKVVEETSDEEDFNKTVTERRHQIEERLSVDRSVPASSQRVEIVQEISSIKRQSLVENKIAEVEHKAVGEIVETPKTTITSNELTISPEVDKSVVDGDRRDSALLEGVTQRFEQKMMKNVVPAEDPKSPKVSKTPPPSPADFISREQTASIQEWDVSKKSAPQGEASVPQDAEQQGLSTTTEHLVASNEETMLDKPLGQQLTGLSVIDDYLVTDLKTICGQTNAFIQFESQPEPYDALADKYTKKEPINVKKVDDNKNNMNEKKKAKKGFFGSIKTFVERSFESDSESEKSPKKSKKPKKEKKKKSKDDTVSGGQPALPKKPKLPTPPLEPSDIDSIPFAEASISDLPPSYKPPDIPPKEEAIPVTDLDIVVETKHLEQTVPVEEPSKVTEQVIVDEEQNKMKKDKSKDKKKMKGKTVIVEEVTKTIQPLVIEAEEFSIIVDPTKKESPKKSKETFTINIDESIEKKEKEIMEKKPILSEEKILKPVAALEMRSDAPIRPLRAKDHIYEDIEAPQVTIPYEHIKDLTTDLIQNEINFGGWSDVYKAPEKPEKDVDTQKEIIEKHDKEVLKERDVKTKVDDADGKKKSGFFGLFKKKDSKKDEEPTVQTETPSTIEKDKKTALSEQVLKDINDSHEFLSGEVQNYHDARPIPTDTKITTDTSTVSETVIPKPVEAEPKVIPVSVEAEPKTQTEGFFGLFKKTKKEEKLPTEVKKSSDKSTEEKKVAVLLSEEVLKNILDSKRFLEGEVQNYHDVRPDVDKKETVVKLTEEVIPLKEVIDDILAEKTSEEIFKKSVEEKKESSPKRTTEDKKEPSPKSSPRFFGLFRKAKKDESDANQSMSVDSDEVLKQIKETDEFLITEVENYHDVKPVVEEKLIKPDEVQATELALAENITENEAEIVTDKDLTKPTEQPSFGFLGFFKKTKKEEDKPEPEVVPQPVQVMNDVITIEEKAENVMEVEDDARKTIDSKDSSATGFFSLFKKQKKDVEDKTLFSESVLKDMDDTNQFLSTELDNYDDVKPAKFELLSEEKVSTVEVSKPTKGVLGVFKKSKKDQEDTAARSGSVESDKKGKEIEEPLKDEKETLKSTEGDSTVKQSEEAESSPKPSRGLFGIFKKTKKDQEDVPEPKSVISEVALKAMNDTKSFLSTEIENYQDDREQNIQKTEPEVDKVTKEVSHGSPKLSGVFGIFKKSKKDQEDLIEPKTVDIRDKPKDSTILDSSVTEKFVEATEAVSTVKEEASSTVVEIVESSKPSKGLFGIFKKKSKDEDETTVLKPTVSETVIKQMSETDEFLKGEVQNYHDVKPEVPLEKVRAPKPAETTLTKDFQDMPSQFAVDADKAASEETLRNIKNTESFLAEEVQKYEDARVPQRQKVSEAVETSPKPSTKILRIFKKPSKEDSEDAVVPTEEKHLVTKEVGETNLDKSQPFEEEIKTNVKVESQDVEVKPEEKVGFLSKFKKTKKSSIQKAPLPEEVQESLVNTKNFISTEIENYEDARQPVVEKDKKEEKTVTFDITKSKIVLESHLPQPEVAHVVEVTKAQIPNVADVEEEASEVRDVVVQEIIDVQQTQEQDDALSKKDKDKPTKDKKGFFSRFGKKSKSQDASAEEPRGRSQEETEGSPKKQKRRKSGSPFKFFDKMRKSEEVEEPEVSSVEKIEDTAQVIKEELLNIEFEKQPSMNLTEEVIGSLDKKMEEMKTKHVSEAQKQINDCRDFLFIEVDNYDDSKPIVVTDIDTGLSTDAGKVVDSIIDKAASVVQSSKSQSDTVKKEVIDSATQEDESTQKSAKKGEKKAGFFSKIGSLISGSVDDAKSEVKEVKKTGAKITDKAKEVIVKDTEAGVEQVKQIGSDTVTEIKKDAKEISETLLKEGEEKITKTDDELKDIIKKTKQEVSTLKDSLHEVTAKTSEKVEKIKETATDKAVVVGEEFRDMQRGATEKVQEVKLDVEQSSKEALDKVKSLVSESTEEFKTDTKKNGLEKIEKLGEVGQSLSQASAEGAASVTKEIRLVCDKGKETAANVLENVLDAAIPEKLDDKNIPLKIDIDEREATEELLPKHDKIKKQALEEIKDKVKSPVESTIKIHGAIERDLTDTTVQETKDEQSILGIKDKITDAGKEVLASTFGQILTSEKEIKVDKDKSSKIELKKEQLKEPTISDTITKKADTLSSTFDNGNIVVESKMILKVDEPGEKKSEKIEDTVSKIITKGDETVATLESLQKEIQDAIKEDKERISKIVTTKGKTVKTDLENAIVTRADETKEAVSEVIEDVKSKTEQKVGEITQQKKDDLFEIKKKVDDLVSGSTTKTDLKKEEVKTSEHKPAGETLGRFESKEDDEEDDVLKSGSILDDFVKRTENIKEGIKSSEKKLKTTADEKIQSIKEVGRSLKDDVKGGLEKTRDDSVNVAAGLLQDVQKVKDDVHEVIGAKVDILTEPKSTDLQKTGTSTDGKKQEVISSRDLDDELAKLTSSLESLGQPIGESLEKVKSYVTSPTMARRAESQRFSREERPAVYEVKTVQEDDISDEELYTVTEPEDVEQKKRKPLFHLESEEEDFSDLLKAKDRRDSVRSNVLESLTENKLDNLLSDLETQLVKDLEGSVTKQEKVVENKLSKAENELEELKKDSQADVEQIEQKLRDLDKALDSLEQASDPKLEKKLHRVERKFERMASDALEKDVSGVSPTEVEARREHEFQRLVSQLSTEEVSDFQKEYSHLWDETTFSKSDDWDSKTPDSQVDVQELPQGEESSLATAGVSSEGTLKVEGEESTTSDQTTDQTTTQQRPITDQHQLSEEMKQLLKELEEESKQ